MQFEAVPDDNIKKELNLQEELLKGLPETDIEITQGDIESIVNTNPSENLTDYWNGLSDKQKEILIARAQQLYRPAK